ncbi:hypothetical protein [Streptomyces aurantiogriseus]|uniref:Uncharacterized protein n=1 Tax=Streptomyces aurantiogriseus TaxID=66870 RepID=A0A918L034_9ACTN|nr:hypothetical protein [Streptomyces aurantiogriseus]GGR61487.1 hypothetical protein GCM10010251_92920 [Streptomyces aurantiogriseus]
MPSIAPLVAAIQRRLANLPGPMRASGEASNGEPVLVEIWVNGEWVDITSYVLVRDNSGRITITSGIRGGEGSETQAATAELQLENPDGRFTPRNPSGVWYGSIGRNTPIRVSVPDGNGGKSYRIWGEVSEWAPNWDSTGSDVWTDVSVNGIIQRLAQGPAPERSILYRAITDPLLDGLVAYWPCEDPTGSIELKSALTNGSSMTWTGNPSLAAYDGFGASDPLPTLTEASLVGGVAKYDTTGVTQYQMRFLLYTPPRGFSDLDCIARLQVQEVAAGVNLLNYFDIHYNNPAGGVGSYGGPGTLTIQVRDGDEAIFGSAASTTMDVRGRLLRVSLENSISGSTITSTLRVLDVNSGVTDSASITIGSTSLSRVLSMSLASATLSSTAGLTDGAAGHLMLQNTISSITDLGRAIQPTGEAAGRRIQRLCAEEGIPFEWVGDLDDTVAMGPQGKQNLLSLVQECVLADGGFLYETVERGLGYRPRASLYNQDPALVLDYTGYNLSEVPVPVEDDRYIQNRLTVTVGGVSETYEETTGALGTDRIGTYGETSGLTLNLASSDAATLRDHAAWRVHLGTVDEARYPKISINLAHPSITPEMKRAILALRLGDRMQITNMPSAWLPPDTVDQLILGREESLTHFQHRLSFICRPASPYSYIGVLDDADARIDIDTELYEAADASDTSLVVVPSVGEVSLWTKDSADWPFDVRLGGEVVRVTAVSDWLSDTFTRTESNGWGSADTGAAWSTSGGSASDYAVNGSAGVSTLSTVDESRRTSVTAAGPNFDLYCDVTTSALATGDSLYGGVTARMQDSSNMYQVRLAFTTSNTITVQLMRMVASTQTSLASYTLPDTHVAGQFVRVRFQGVGASFKAKAWMATAAVEPPEWHLTATDSSISAAHSFGTRSIRVTGNTNAASVAIQYDNYRVINPQTLTVTRSVNGVTKSHEAGTPVSLAYPTYIAL